MHIKEIRVDGFKSFGEPTTVPFYEGFTTISGPNGSGKSNLIDSILFALGLARTRGMRARRLPDLLYDPPEGESAREASVEVVLDNEDRTVTEEEIRSACGELKHPDEIVVKRRIKKTENDYYSYYYLNGRSVNLSDVQDLLENAGVTPEGYNVVMQGDVTNVVQASPVERRGIVEEIAGTAKFDEKKEEAEEELGVVEERVEEVELVLDEIEDRLDELADERDKALEYQDLKEEKQEYESYLAAARLRDIEEEVESLEGKVESACDRRDELADELEAANHELDALKEELAELNDEIAAKGEDERLELKSELEEIKGKISTNEERISDAEDAIDELDNERREAFVGADKAREEVGDIEDDIKDAKVRKSSLKSKMVKKGNELEEVEDEIAEIEGEYADVRESLQEAKERGDELRDERNELQREKDRLLDEARRRTREVEEASDELEAANDEIEDVERERDELESRLETERKNLRQLEEVRDDLRDERDELESRLNEIDDKLRAKQEEYAQAEARSGGGGGSSYGRAVSAVLNSGIDGVHGTVADLGSVAGEYSTACETAAGGRMANVVVDDDGVGQDCIEYLKSRNSGRATFLPLNEMHDRSLSSSPLGRDGVVDYAYNLVEFDHEYSGVFSYVLGDTLVVEDIETARDMMGSYRMVTLGGDLVEKSGAMTGGSKQESRYSFGSKGAVQRLADRIEELESERRGVRDELADVKGRLEEVGDDLREKKDDVERFESRIGELDDREEELREAIADAEERLADAEDERDETRERMEEIDDEIDELTAEVEDAEERADELRDELEGSRVSELTDRADELRGEIDELRDEVRDVDSELNELELEKGYKEDAIDEYQERIQEIDEKKTEKNELIDELRDEIDELEDRADDKRAEIEEIDDEIGELRDERDALKESVEEKTEERDEARRAVERADDRIDSLTDQLADKRDERDELADEVEEMPDDVPDLDELRDEISRVEDEMEALEPVNMLAIEEYDKVKTRQEDLQNRKKTLEDEAGEIRARIEEYEETKRDKFLEAFDAIDDHFREIFQRLSDGTGELVLDDHDAPFESGMTIEAKPRDKPVKRLEQMSGGERSLTALSFIFAVQRYTPAPFYAFDEVDESLDAVNVEKVAETINEIADATQFVVISHRSNMVEKADRIVGVTMQEDNVSRVTGVKVSDSGDGDTTATAD